MALLRNENLKGNTAFVVQKTVIFLKPKFVDAE